MNGVRLKRIELSGFKSFPDRTVFELPGGITAIIGPNGCGKSNVFDAIKWCIGEHSVKALRIKSSEDVLFSGNERRKASNMCEVALVFEGDLILKKEGVPELKIERRFYRTGESEYYMNERNVKLKDIQDFLFDIGFGTHSIAIVEQGEITTLATGKPEDLRLYLDEASGIMKYKLRYREALKKLEFTKTQLERVEDVLSEVKRQINSVQKYAKKAEKARKLKEKIKELELLIFGHEFREKKERLSLINSALSILTGKMEASKREVEECEKELGRISEEMRKRESRLLELEEECEALKKEKEKIEKELASLESSLKLLEQRSYSLSLSMKELNVKIEKNAEKRAELEKFLPEKEGSLRILSEEREKIRKKIEDLKREIDNLSREFSSKKELFFELSSSSLKIKGEMIDRRREMELKMKELERRVKEGEKLKEALSLLQEVQSGLQREKEEVEMNLSTTLSEQEALEREIKELSTKMEEVASRITKLRKEKEEVVAKLEAIERVRKEYGFYEEGVKFLLTVGNEDGFRGTVAECIEVERGYEKAVEAALRGYASSIIVEDIKIALKGIKRLKEEGAGEAGFFITNGFKKPDHPGAKSGGELGRLSDFVKPKNHYGEKIKELFHNVFVVDSPSAFERIPSELAEEGVFVTPEGDIFERGILLHGGKSAGGIFSKEREMKDLAENAALLSSEILSLASQMKAFETRKEELEREVLTIKEKVKGYEKRLFEIGHNLSFNDKEIKRLRENLRIVEEEIKAFDGEVKSLKLEEEELRKRLEEAERQNAEIKRETEGIEKKEAELERELRTAMELLAEKESAFSSANAELLGLSKEIERLKEEREELKAKGMEIYAEAVKACFDRLNCERKRTSLKKEKEKLDLLINELESKRGAFQREFSAFTTGREDLHRRIDEKRKEVEKLVEERSKLSEEKVQIETTLSFVKEDMFKKYSVDIEKVQPGPVENMDALKNELSYYMEEYEKLGDVSMHALDEYEELTERYSFLSSQKEDLLKGMKDVETMVKRIKEETKERFRETFNAVREKFNHFVSLLMEGGKGEIILVDPEDLFDSGIELFVQPAGKRLRHLGLLSGGEKALVALAYIFSILTVKNVPFAFFDEIDAPLDDLNIQRFVNLLKSIAETSQVVIITHNKLTMSHASAIYGISMEEPGVSRFISVKLKS